MKLIKNNMRTIYRVVYIFLLIAVIVSLIAIGVISESKDNEWLMWLILGVGYILMFVIENFLCEKFPEVFPTTEKEKEFMRMIEEIAEKEENDSPVVLPRTWVGTLCELATVSIVAYALYRAWTLDQRMIGVLGLSFLALAFLYGAYHPNFLKKQLDVPSDMKACLVIADKSRVRAIFGALCALLLTFFYDQDMFYRWRPICIGVILLLLIMSLILNYLSRRSSALTVKENNYNPAEKKVMRTVEGSTFEIATILFLIGAWCTAAINHQLSGKGLLDIPVADLIMCTTVAIVALVLSYFPKWMGNAASFKNDRQVLLDIRRHRIYAVVFAFLALMILFIPELNDPKVNDKMLGIIYIVTLTILRFAVPNRKILQAGEPEGTNGQEKDETNR